MRMHITIQHDPNSTKHPTKMKVNNDAPFFALNPAAKGTSKMCA